MELPVNEPEESCPVYINEFVLTMIVWSDLTDQPLRPDCLAMEKSYGCSDD
jgi:hypothetical protein